MEAGTSAAHHARGAAVGVVVLALTAALMIAGPHGRAEADVDLTGDWILTFGDPPDALFCPATVDQSGTELSIDFYCEALDVGFLLPGTIDPASGSFEVEACGDPPGPGLYCFSLTGVAASDGNSMSGTWALTGGAMADGPFTGTRTTAPAPPTATQAAAMPTPTAPISPGKPEATVTPAVPRLPDVSALPSTGSGGLADGR
ncbi:MAG: hypothetical protein Q8S13_13750 [Dehalococcoidia bacterium]|nr:hypothetical protein [Dehalococcoidia bacterium]